SSRLTPDHTAESVERRGKQVLLTLVQIGRAGRLHGFNLPLLAMPEHHLQKWTRKALEQRSGYWLEIRVLGLAEIGANPHLMGCVPVIGGRVNLLGFL